MLPKKREFTRYSVIHRSCHGTVRPVNVNPVAFKTIRELAGLSQAELARRTGISQGHISQIEAGQKHPRPPTVHRFAQALGVPIASLISSNDLPD